MTITSTQNRVSYSGNGSTTAFSVPFRFLASADLAVLVRVDATGADTVKTLDTHYSVSGAGAASGGSVTALAGSIPQTGETLIIYGNPAMTQLVDYIAGGVFPAESHEEALDRLTLQSTRSRELVERTPRLMEGDTDGSGQYDANSNRISNLGTPTATTDAATKTYTDTLVNNTALGPAPTGLIATGSVTSRLLADRWGEVANIKDFGAVGDGVTDDTSALTAAEAASNYVYIPPSSSFYVLTQVPSLTKTWGEGVCKVSGNRVYVRPTSEPASLIYASIFDIPAFGTDGAPAVQRAIDYAQSVDLPLSMPVRTIIQTDSTLVIKQGNVNVADITANGRNHFTLIGNHCEIRSNVDDAALWVQPQATSAAMLAEPGIEWGHIHISDLEFDGALAVTNSLTSAYALRVGRQGYQISGTVKDTYKNITVRDYTSAVMTGQAVRFTNVQLFDVENLTIMDEGGLLLEASSNDVNSWFAGDVQFTKCWFTGSLTRRPIYIRGNNTVPASGKQASCAGIVFSNCQILDPGVRIWAGEYDFHRAITFDNCEFDVGAANERAIEILTTGTSASPGQVDRIFFINCDVSAFKGASYHFSATGNGFGDQIQILGGAVFLAEDGAGDTSAIVIDGMQQVMIRDVMFKQMQCSVAAIYITSSTHVSVMGCTGDLAFTPNADFVRIDDDATCNDWMIVGNAASANGTGSVANVIAGAGGGTGLLANNLKTTT